MIAVNNGGKPRIQLIQAHNDMSNFTPSHFTVIGSSWGWMELSDYMDKKEFEQFDMKPKPDRSVDQTEEIIKKIMAGEAIEFHETVGNPNMRFAYELQNHLKKSGGTLEWQYNIINPNLDGWTRRMTFLGAGDKYGICR